ncbi:hypothetical protein LPJ59_003954 [Coemansia sp. RSA 2399]|nr:hypothetical protein LPJ59_003954 [Coemansia sp. RSA 2399]KAJ1902230.1 hypothetical protein LPJ81_003631 [Coemansia sp. IMI 209127]
MLRSLLPAPTTLLGCIPLEPGVTAVATLTLAWNLLNTATGLHSPWVLYTVWMVVSSCALFYARYKRDLSHARWFAMALFIDIMVYAVSIPYDKEFTMSDAEQCTVAMSTNRDLTMDHCLAHVHEIRNIAYMIRIASLLGKTYLAGLARSYELTLTQS